jgi:metal-responsive CopG/Arc/MetJ family transcriptional regulator
MQVKPTVVRLSIETLEEIDAIAGPNRRAEFIREAVRRELKRLSKKGVPAHKNAP